jgi:hypothetical protein
MGDTSRDAPPANHVAHHLFQDTRRRPPHASRSPLIHPECVRRVERREAVRDRDHLTIRDVLTDGLRDNAHLALNPGRTNCTPDARCRSPQPAVSRTASPSFLLSHERHPVVTSRPRATVLAWWCAHKIRAAAGVSAWLEALLLGSTVAACESAVGRLSVGHAFPLMGVRIWEPDVFAFLNDCMRRRRLNGSWGMVSPSRAGWGHHASRFC